MPVLIVRIVPLQPQYLQASSFMSRCDATEIGQLGICVASTLLWFRIFQA